ncbi:hypothetical protein BgiMline_017303, partial [Biomphalaria glabrata]
MPQSLVLTHRRVDIFNSTNIEVRNNSRGSYEDDCNSLYSDCGEDNKMYGETSPRDQVRTNGSPVS